MRPRFEIVVRQQGVELKRYALTQGHAVSIGRGARCTIRLDDSANNISRVHVVVTSEGRNEWRVVDQQTPNGTWLESRRLASGKPGTIWPPGRLLKIGKYELELSADDAVTGSSGPAQAQPEQPPLPKHVMLIQRRGPGEPQFYLLPGPEHRVGREPSAGNDIVVPSDMIDKQHLAVTVGEHCTVKVLNSINGTTLAGRPLRTGNEREWRPGAPVMTLDWNFEVVAWREQSNTEVSAAIVDEEAIPEGNRVNAKPGADMSIKVRIRIAPSREGKAGSGRFHYLVCAIGQSPVWKMDAADTQRAGSMLEAGSEQTLNVQMALPTDARAGQYPILLAVLRADGQLWRVISFLPLVIDVEAVPKLTPDLTPPASHALRLGASQRVVLTNSGNVPLAVTAVPSDEKHKLDFTILDVGEPPHLYLPVGAQGSLRISPGLHGRPGFLRYFRLFGGEETLKFQVKATTNSNYDLPLPEVAVKSAPFIPPPLQPWIVPLILIMCAVMGVLLWQVLQPKVELVSDECNPTDAADATVCGLKVKESGLGRTTIGKNNKSLIPNPTPQHEESSHWLQRIVLYPVPAAPGDLLTVQRSFLGFSPVVSMTVPLRPNDIVSMTVMPDVILCGTYGSVEVTVELDRQPDAGQLEILMGADELRHVSDPDNPARYRAQFDVHSSRVSGTPFHCPTPFEEGSIQFVANLKSTNAQPPVSKSAEVRLRPALCKLKPESQVYGGQTTKFELRRDYQSNARIAITTNIYRGDEGEWVEVKIENYDPASWVSRQDLDCSSALEVERALADDDFSKPSVLFTPTSTATPVPPTPTPAATPAPPATPIPEIPLWDQELGFYAGFRRQEKNTSLCILEGYGFFGPEGIWLRDKEKSGNCGDKNKVNLNTEQNGDVTTGRLSPTTPIPCESVSRYLLEVKPEGQPPICKTIPIVE